MALVAPVNLPYNIKTLWFDPAGLELHADDSVVVETARGLELGVLASEPFEVAYEDIKKLKSPLKPVKRMATDEDLQRADEMEQKAREAMPVFKSMAREYNEDMHPVSVEFMLDGDKAVFYFESEERIDFRELVRKLASEFHVRIDMRQIGVRDEARIVGGIAHCGQLVCCKRLGGEFKPVSIRMAKDQDLSLNPQKISGLCGRLMCCLRYEDEVYKEFKKGVPKIGAVVSTPEGEGKVVEYDVPRDTIAIRVEDDKPVKVPASAIEDLSEDRKSAVVSDEAWEKAVEDAQVSIFGGADLISIPSFTGEDKLGSATAVHHEQSKKDRPARSQRRSGSRRSGSGGSGGSGRGSGGSGGETQVKRQPRRRSTTIKAEDGSKTTVTGDGKTSKSGGQQKDAQKKQGGTRRSRSGGKKSSQNNSSQKKTQAVRPGQKSSGLAHDDSATNSRKGEGKQGSNANHRRRRRRSSGKGGQGQGSSQNQQGKQSSQGGSPASSGE